MNSIGEILAANCKRLRAQRKWNQDQLAEHAGISIDSVRNIETSRAWAGINTITKLAKAFKVPESELFITSGTITHQEYTKALSKLTDMEIELDQQKLLNRAQSLEIKKYKEELTLDLELRALLSLPMEQQDLVRKLIRHLEAGDFDETKLQVIFTFIKGLGIKKGIKGTHLKEPKSKRAQAG